MMTKQDEFIKDLQWLLNKHGAYLEITEDGTPWGYHIGIAEVYIPGEGTRRLPCYMVPDDA